MVQRYDETMIQVLPSVILQPGQRYMSPLSKIIF